MLRLWSEETGPDLSPKLSDSNLRIQDLNLRFNFEVFSFRLLVFLDILSSESSDSEQHPKLFVFPFVFSSNVGTFEKKYLTIPLPLWSCHVLTQAAMVSLQPRLKALKQRVVGGSQPSSVIENSWSKHLSLIDWSIDHSPSGSPLPLQSFLWD